MFGIRHQSRALVAAASALMTAGCSGAGGAADPRPTPAAPPTAADAGLVVTVTSDELLTRLPLGEPLTLTVEVANHEARSVGATVDVTLVAPDGTELVVHRTRLFVPFGDRASENLELTTSRWYATTGAYEVRAVVTDADVTTTPGRLEFTVGDTMRTIPRFEDVTDSAGLTTTVPIPECGQFANGAAWGDVDGDGWPDLVVTRLGDPVQLFMNRGDGTFADETSARGISVIGANGAAFADHDNDGDLDLVLVGDGANVMLRNDGSGSFQDVTETAGIAGHPDARSMSATWGDYDGDGFLDLYVTNYMRCTGPWTTSGEIIENVDYDADVLYRNRGDGTFADATSELPDHRDNGAGFTAAWADVDGDGRPDLYVANDFVGPSPDHNRLWRNTGPSDGGWTFADESLDSGAGLYMNTMGVGIGDVDRDGDLDLALSNIGGNKLLRNAGDGTFVEETSTGIERPNQGVDHLSVTWGTAFYDLDLDGWEDLFLAAGNLQQGPEVVIGPQPNMVFLNDGSGTRFLDVSALTGVDGTGESKGVAFADYDRDGAVDVFVVDQAGSPHLYRNVTPRAGRHWLAVELTGTRSNPHGCGARVTAVVPDGAITRAALCGSGATGSSHEHLVHFGLGDSTSVDSLEIVWPSGVRQRLTDVAADQVLRVVEPTG